MMDGWDMSGWGWAWMSFWMVFGVALVGLLVVLVLRQPSLPRSPDEDDPRRILQRRFAAGEIDEEEYRRRHAEINSGWDSTNAKHTPQ
jgi:putative membrane protein